MRFNFRKISAIAASAVMLVSTAGIAAAAAYPAPFVTSSTASAGIVVGTGSSVLDSVQAANIKADLGTRTGKTTKTVTSCSGGDCYLLELASTKLNMNDTVKSVRTSDLDKNDLPNVLASLEYKSGDTKTYKYEQKITLPGTSTTGLTYQPFADDDYNDKKPSLGFKIKDGKDILNYSIIWSKNPESSVDSALRLEDLENSEITLLGKTFTILNAYNGSVNSQRVKIELMGGAIVDDINFGETETHTLEGKSYAVRLAFIDDTEAKLCVSIDGATEECQSNLAKGETFELSDGVQVGIRSINYVSKTGRTDSVDFSLGAQKLTLEDNQTVKLNDENVQGLKVEIPHTHSSGIQKIQNMKFMWEANEDLFIADDAVVEMPGLGGLKIASGGFYAPAQEEIKVQNDGSKGVELVIPIKSGTAKIPLIYRANESAFGYIGSDADELVNTGNWSTLISGSSTPMILYNHSYGDRYFVASWNSTTDSESYLLTVSDFSDDSTTGKNYTDVQDKVTGETVCDNKQNGDSCTVGNVVITFGTINKKSKSVELTLNAGGSFNRVYSSEGAMFYLPVPTNSTGNTGVAGVSSNPSWINITHRRAGVPNVDATNTTSWKLQMFEEDNNDNLGKGEGINFTLSLESDGDTRVQNVRGVWASSTSTASDPNLETEKDSDKYLEWTKSYLATMVTHNRVSGSQYTADIEYHGGESYGQIYFAAPSADVGSTSTSTATVSTGDFVLVTDAEVSSVASKDLIVIGGTCINSAAAKLLDVSVGTCGAAWEEKTGIGSGEFLIQSFGDAYAAGKVALLVAGYNAEDTQLAAESLTSKAIDTAAGNKYTGGISAELTKVVAQA